MKKMIEAVKKILASMGRSFKEAEPYIHSLGYDNCALQYIAM